MNMSAEFVTHLKTWFIFFQSVASLLMSYSTSSIISKRRLNSLYSLSDVMHSWLMKTSHLGSFVCGILLFYPKEREEHAPSLILYIYTHTHNTTHTHIREVKASPDWMGERKMDVTCLNLDLGWCMSVLSGQKYFRFRWFIFPFTLQDEIVPRNVKLSTIQCTMFGFVLLCNYGISAVVRRRKCGCY